MPLNIAHHKSYHPYNRENIERVRRDEEAARSELAEQEERRRQGQSHDRLAALRAQRGDASTVPPPEARPRDRLEGSSKQRKQAEETAFDAGPSLSALVSQTPWYDDPDLRTHKERQRTHDQRLEAAYKDSATKSSNDPLKVMEGFLAQRAEHIKRQQPDTAPLQTDTEPSLSSYRHYVRDDWKHKPEQEQDFRERQHLFDPGGATAIATAETTATNADDAIITTTSEAPAEQFKQMLRSITEPQDIAPIKIDPDTPVDEMTHQPVTAAGGADRHSRLPAVTAPVDGAPPIAIKNETELEDILAAHDESTQTPPTGSDKEHKPVIGDHNSALDDLSADSLETFQKSDESREIPGHNAPPPYARESMYPVLLGDMIDTVLAEESYLFDEIELATLRSYALLPYDARYLFSRLIQRRDSWLRIEALRTAYSTEGREGIDVEAAVSSLTANVEGSSNSRYLITHADAGDAGQESLLQLLTLDELKNLAKRMQTPKVGTTKASIVKALLTTRSQGTLMSALQSAKKPHQQTSPSAKGQLSLNFTSGGKKASQSVRLANEVTALLGLLVRVESNTRSLIDRVALVFYRGSMLGGTALTTAVLARSRRRNYPRYQVQRSSRVFPSRENLLAFEEALRIEAEMEELLQWGDNSEATWQKALKLFESIWPIWKRTVDDFDLQQSKRGDVAGASTWSVDASDRMTYHRMRFHAGWPQTRVVYKGATILARFKLHEREEEVLKALLGQRYFRRGKRGEWYDRLALITAMYTLGNGESAPQKTSSTSTAAKTQSKMNALKIAVHGVEDPDTHLIYHDTLQRRITRLENQLPIPKSQKHDFSYAKLKQCAERTYIGVRLDYMDHGQDERQQLLFPGLSARNASPQKEGDDRIATASPLGSRFTARAPMRKIVKVEQQAQTSPSRSRSRSPQKKAIGATATRPASSFFMKRDNSSSSSDLLLDARMGDTGIVEKQTVSPKPTPDIEGLEDDDKKSGPSASVLAEYEVTRKEQRTSMASVWRGPLDGQPCRVEDVVLQEYQMRGYEGFHDEGGILKMLFTMCLWDVIFSPADSGISDVFETPYQRAPLDLGQDSFSITRGPRLRQRLAEISSGAAPSLVTTVDEGERPRKTWAIGCRWDSYPLESLIAVATLLPGPTLSTIFTMMAEEWEHCSSGMPDLIVWNTEEKVVRLCEVKSINDRLSETQKVWIDVLLRAGVEVEVSLVRETEDSMAKGSSGRPPLVRKRSSGSGSNVMSGSGSPLKRRVS